jgi:hypothetical protein
MNKDLIARAYDIAKRQLPPASSIILYGSAVFQQANRNPHQKTIDLLLLVPDSSAFHTANARANPGHYSGLGRLLGAGFVDYLKRVHPAFFVNGVEMDGLPFKYGVV